MPPNHCGGPAGTAMPELRRTLQSQRGGLGRPRLRSLAPLRQRAPGGSVRRGSRRPNTATAAPAASATGNRNRTRSADCGAAAALVRSAWCAGRSAGGASVRRAAAALPAARLRVEELFPDPDATSNAPFAVSSSRVRLLRSLGVFAHGRWPRLLGCSVPLLPLRRRESLVSEQDGL